VRFLSLEPLLGDIDLRLGESVELSPGLATTRRHLIQWAIVGGESGNRARTCSVPAVRSVVEQCASAQVSCFVKQLGKRPMVGPNEKPDDWGPDVRWKEDVAEDALQEIRLRSSKGVDPSEWPSDLRVQQFPPSVRAA
jgi:hypothetical protein